MAAASLACVENGGTAAAHAGKPVMDVPGATPTSPVMSVCVAPHAAVTLVPPTTAKLCAAPTVCASDVDGALTSATRATPAAAIKFLRFIENLPSIGSTGTVVGSGRQAMFTLEHREM